MPSYRGFASLLLLACALATGSPVLSADELAPDRSMWILVDTPFTDAWTGRLLDRMKERHDRPVELAVLIHSHDDRTGGIATLHERDVTSITAALTAQHLIPIRGTRPTTSWSGSRHGSSSMSQDLIEAARDADSR